MMLDYRTVWISDIHLGTRGCQAEYLRDFLNNVECDTLYLVGDIIDYWKLKSGIYWPYMHNEVVRKILDKAKNGTRVVYIPGNHDEIFRQYAGSEFLGVEIRRNAVHCRKYAMNFSWESCTRQFTSNLAPSVCWA